MRFLAATFIFLASTSASALAESKSVNIELAARLNVAENLCDVNFNSRSPGGVVHYVLLGAAELDITVDEAAKLADKRHTEIVAYLNRAKKLDEFCTNIRTGKF